MSRLSIFEATALTSAYSAEETIEAASARIGELGKTMRAASERSDNSALKGFLGVMAEKSEQTAELLSELTHSGPSLSR